MPVHLYMSFVHASYLSVCHEKLPDGEVAVASTVLHAEQHVVECLRLLARPVQGTFFLKTAKKSRTKCDNGQAKNGRLRVKHHISAYLCKSLQDLLYANLDLDLRVRRPFCKLLFCCNLDRKMVQRIRHVLFMLDDAVETEGHQGVTA